MVTLLLIAAAFSGAAQSPQYAFFSQATVASHGDGFDHGLPCMARLQADRVLLAWSRWKPGSDDFAVVGALSPDCGCTWSAVTVFIDHAGLLDADSGIVVCGDRVFLTCTTVSFAKGIRTSTTWCIRSDDNAKTWSAPYEIAMNHKYTCGKCHHGIRLKSGTLLMGYSWDVVCEQGQAHQSEGEMDLRAGVMRSTDDGITWTNGGDTTATYEKVAGGAVAGTDEPALVALDDGSVLMLMRTGSTHLYEARSRDEGQTWQDIKPSPLTGTNAPAALSRFRAGSGQGIFAAWDNAQDRFPLCVAASFDGGTTWSAPRDIGQPYTGGQASYPSVDQAPDGTLLAAWQQDVPGGRDIRLARFSVDWLVQPAITIVLFGESTTAARGPLRVFGQLLQEDLPARGIPCKVVNAGLGGEITSHARERFDADVLAQHPNYVTIYYGLNDACVDVWKGATEPRVPVGQFEANLRYFAQTLKEQGATPILLTPNPCSWSPQQRELYGKPPYNPDDPEGINVLLTGYVEAVRKVAREENVPLLDVFQLLHDLAKQPDAPPVTLDGIHPNDYAHRKIANALINLIAP